MTNAPVTSITDELLAELEQLAGKATPGPWTSGEPIIGVRRFIVADICGRMVYPATNEITHGTSAVDDAAYIAAANPATILSLLQHVRELRRDSETLRLYSSIIDEIDRRAGKQHCLEDQCDFTVTIQYEDYAVIAAYDAARSSTS